MINLFVNKDIIKAKTALLLGYNMIRIWCSRKSEVLKLKRAIEKLTGDDLAEFISAIPEGMINSVNLLKGVVDYTANGENHITGNAVPSLKRNLFEGVETKVDPKSVITYGNKILK